MTFQTINASTISQQSLNADGPYDIVCGRQKAAFNSIGNRRFRVTMSLNLEAYMKAKTKIERSVLVASIVSYLKEDVGARFLKPNGQYYVELTENQAREKVSHALRDQAVQKRKGAPLTTRKASVSKRPRKQQQTENKKKQQQSKISGNDFACPASLLQQRILKTLIMDLEPIPLADVILSV